MAPRKTAAVAAAAAPEAAVLDLGAPAVAVAPAPAPAPAKRPSKKPLAAPAAPLPDVLEHDDDDAAMEDAAAPPPAADAAKPPRRKYLAPTAIIQALQKGQTDKAIEMLGKLEGQLAGLRIGKATPAVKKAPTRYNLFIRARMLALKDERPDVTAATKRMELATAEWKAMPEAEREAWRPAEEAAAAVAVA
jgi:hypothetical protein